MFTSDPTAYPRNVHRSYMFIIIRVQKLRKAQKPLCLAKMHSDKSGLLKNDVICQRTMTNSNVPIYSVPTLGNVGCLTIPFPQSLHCILLYVRCSIECYIAFFRLLQLPPSFVFLPYSFNAPLPPPPYYLSILSFRAKRVLRSVTSSRIESSLSGACRYSRLRRASRST